MARLFDVAVIGAGADGLTAACALAGRGLRVVVLERADAVGGQRRAVDLAGGFRTTPFAFDAGWLSPVVSQGLGLAGAEVVPLEAPLTSIVAPGSCLTLWSQPARAAEAIRAHSARDAAAWPEFASKVRRIAGFLERLYQSPAPDIDSVSLRELPPLLALGRAYRGLGRQGMPELLRTLPMSIWELLDDTFESAALKAALAPGGVQNLRQGPRSGGTAFVFLHHLTGAPHGTMRGRGRFRAGTAGFIRAVEAEARKRGVTLRTSASVEKILVKNDAVAGLILKGGEAMDVSAAISTADPSRTLLGMVDPVWLDPEFLHAVRQIKYRGCTASISFALDALPAFPGLASQEALAGIVTLTPSVEALERAADAAKYGRISERLHVEITVPTIHDATLAPAGKHLLIARAQYVPYRLRPGSTPPAADPGEVANAVTSILEAHAPGFSARVLHRGALAPREIEEHYGLTEGALTHGEITLDQILFMRPVPGWGRHATPIRGLYLGGAGTHPGPGLLGAPGWLAARQLLSDRGRS